MCFALFKSVHYHRYVIHHHHPTKLNTAAFVIGCIASFGVVLVGAFQVGFLSLTMWFDTCVLSQMNVQQPIDLISISVDCSSDPALDWRLYGLHWSNDIWLVDCHNIVASVGATCTRHGHRLLQISFSHFRKRCHNYQYPFVNTSPTCFRLGSN